MEKNDKTINSYAIHYNEMINSNLYHGSKNDNKKNRKIYDEDAFEKNKDHFNPSIWID